MQQKKQSMRVHWWQSIRWRLALGSMLVTLLATVPLAIISIITINIAYGGDQTQQLTNLADGTAYRIGKNYVHTGSLFPAAEETVPGLSSQTTTSEAYLQLVYSDARPSKLIYPRANNGRTLPTSLLVLATDGSGDYTTILQAINRAHAGIFTTNQSDAQAPAGSSHLFVVEPIFLDGLNSNPIVGILLVIPRSTVDNTVPPFIATVRQSILIAAVIVAVLMALLAIFFSRTITRPLARLTKTAHVLAGGNYSARVETNTRGEIGELATSFNEMAGRLEQDMAELRQQELRRRELIMNITHDLATPLTAIAGLGEALVDGVSQNREDFEETGRVIVRETLRLRRLVKDLHMMSKAETGAMQPQRRAVRLAPLIDEVLAVLIPEFERVDVEPCNNVPYNLPIVWADPDMLNRVFDNLCSNALRYTPPGGSITIDAASQGTMLLVSVTDSGKGISTDALPRVFDRFYRADSARRTTTGGSGLGLAIVQAIVEAHGGRVMAENAPETGARISFTLPLASANWEQVAGERTLPLPRYPGQVFSNPALTSLPEQLLEAPPRPPLNPPPHM
jgi:signal transduction histidine kinase